MTGAVLLASLRTDADAAEYASASSAVRDALVTAGGSIPGAARALGIGASTLYVLTRTRPDLAQGITLRRPGNPNVKGAAK